MSRDVVRRLMRCLALWVGVAVSGMALPGTAAAGLDEYQVKAAYLYNFAKFIEWPADAFVSPTAPLVIGVYGSDPFGPVLDALLRDKRVGGRPFQVRRSARVAELRNSHIVFVGDGREPLPVVLGALAGTSTLTVGQSGDFLREGGIVLFQIEDGRVVFSIDAAAAGRARLVVSSQLLRLARLNTAGRP